MLPDFGWTELLVISIVLIVVIGPKDLPRILRGFGNTMSSVRRMAGDFRKQFDEALKEAELDDVRKLADDVRSLDPRRQIKDALNPLSEPLEEIGRDIDADMKRAMGDSKLPELPKSAPQMGLEQAGAKARAAQAAKSTSAKAASGKATSGKAAKPAAKASSGAGDTTPAASATAAKAPATARARSKTAKGGASEKPAKGAKPSSKGSANGTAAKPAARKTPARKTAAKPASTKPRKRATAKAPADEGTGGSTPS
ncbi:MAG: Sec-independent protein translocase protein TatB [Phyllobacteriaceae bacterium]|jgi:sec-independent protein translocase protein TatB|nr:Sec-independent protein translocase protein TatB [Phyllobacteriaceae bacterium]